MKMACKECGTVGEPGENPKGRMSWLIFVVLLFFWLFPAILYIVWCAVVRARPACGKCGSESIVGIDTPVGQEIAAKFKPPHEPTAARIAELDIEKIDHWF